MNSEMEETGPNVPLEIKLNNRRKSAFQGMFKNHDQPTTSKSIK